MKEATQEEINFMVKEIKLTRERLYQEKINKKTDVEIFSDAY